MLVSSSQTLTSTSCAGGIPAKEAAEQLAPWRVVHTKSRQEKALAEYLEAREVTYYLPLVRKVCYYGRRKFIVNLPLFPGYLFLRGGLEEAYLAERSDRAVRVIQVMDQRALDRDLANLRLSLERGASLEPTRLPDIGVWVQVRAGPFRGVRGMVERAVQDDRLVLGVRMLGRAAELEIDRSLLEPVD